MIKTGLCCMGEMQAHAVIPLYWGSGKMSVSVEGSLA
jgi:hypothetical protein